jgi:hypothetical protein
MILQINKEGFMDMCMFSDSWSPAMETQSVSVFYVVFRVSSSCHAMSISRCVRFAPHVFVSNSFQIFGAVAQLMRHPMPDCPLIPDLAQAYVTDRAAYEQVLLKVAA